MPKAFCDRHECKYRSLGGWCHLGHPRWVVDENSGGDVNCRLIEQYHQSSGFKGETQ